jgi:uncharacterized protein (DUF2345 family)
MGAQGTATIDFGSGGHAASVAVTGQAGIGSGSHAEAWLMAEASADHNAEEHALVAALSSITCGALIAGTGFTIYGRSTITLSGVWTIRWVWN